MAIRTQIYLDEFQITQLKIQAEKLKTSVSELIRRGVDLVIGKKSAPHLDPQKDPLMKMIGKIHGSKKDSSSIDETIYGE